MHHTVSRKSMHSEWGEGLGKRVERFLRTKDGRDRSHCMSANLQTQKFIFAHTCLVPIPTEK